MPDYHILEQTDNKDCINVIFHFTVPPIAVNEAGILYTDIVKISEDLNSQIPGLQANYPQEYQDMQDGKRIERSIIVRFSANDLTPGQKLNEVINGNALYWEGYTAYKTKLLSMLATKWEWYGYNGTII